MGEASRENTGIGVPSGRRRSAENISGFKRVTPNRATIFSGSGHDTGTVKPLSQFVILDEGHSQIGLVPVPTGIHTGRELAELFK